MAEGMRKEVMKRKGGSGDGKFQHSRKGKKSKRVFSGGDEFRTKKMDWKTKKFFQRKARDYDSDGDDEDIKDVEEKEEEEDEVKVEKERFIVMKDEPISRSRKNASADDDGDNDDDVDGEDGSEQEEVSDDENGEVQPGILRFSGGCKAFRLAFQKITILKTNPSQDDVMGPILSANKNLIAEKLAEEDAELKNKSEARKKKHLADEKGHVKPTNYLDSHEKSLIGIATRGVVKLFNAANKAQYSQKGLNPMRSKDEKVIKKRRREAFFSVLGQNPSNPTGTLSKVESSSGTGSGAGPSWAPLRDNYMVANSKLKDWDKMQDTTTSADDFELPPGAVSSSDDE